MAPAKEPLAKSVGAKIYLMRFKWSYIVDASTVLWLVAFVSSLVVESESIKDLCGLVALLLLPVFICDLVLIYRQEESFKSFIKKRWFDVLLVIPYFRIFRVLRLARLLKFMKITKLKRALRVVRFTKKSKRVAKAVGRQSECF